MLLKTVFRGFFLLFLFFSVHIIAAQHDAYDEALNTIRVARNINKTVNIVVGSCALLHPDPLACGFFLAGCAFTFGSIDFLESIVNRFVSYKGTGLGNKQAQDRANDLLILASIYTVAAVSIAYSLSTCDPRFIDFGVALLLFAGVNSYLRK